MTIRPIVLAASLVALASAGHPARAELVCDADPASLDFGLISVRDGQSQQTSGPVTISCSGGTPGASIVACVSLGAGSGGSGPGLTPRTMSGNGAATLDYQLTANNTLSVGGIIWETVGFAVDLDGSGSATVAPTLYAEVTSIGAQATIGPYLSRFEAGGDVLMSYGETACDQTGTASSFSVQATVTASCTVEVSNMDFGNIDAAIVAPVDQTASITVSCTNGSAYTVGLDHGLHAMDGGPSGRRLANGGNLLAYGLYQDPSRSLGWGSGAGTLVAGVGTGGQQVLAVFGRILADQQAVVGSYSDRVVVTVAY
ncbi:Csu type fimbrial protein [Roseicyclus mahoneyensis]|uniref:Spore coat protein U-like protein n=1 Tax=Roseicyclus mahoneyensis TaxID=164332 RepID=A0A316G5H1_9RHOB|nr:spore coat U domain-containing protein [Roseicyclus mahoneyensis]PWK55873.1 spore coat protein U-like protein [Roseicyclus mahoneyensis]